MEHLFLDRLNELRGRPGARARLWVEAVTDVIVHAAREWSGVAKSMCKQLMREGAGMDGWTQDIRFGIRTLMRRRGFTVAAVLTLALGIGANVSIFSVVNGVLLHPLPYPEPDDLVVLWTVDQVRVDRSRTVDHPDVRTLQAQVPELSLAGFAGTRPTLTGFGDPEVLLGVRVTDGMIDLMGLEPVLGRDLRAADDVEGGPRVTVISHAFWADVTSRVEELPGVVAVGTTQSHPLMGSNWGASMRIAGHDTGEETGRGVRITYGSPGLFDALGFTMAQGRALTQADATDAQRVAVVNQTFVRRYLSPGEDPLSTTLLGANESTIQVVGVVEDVIEEGVDDDIGPALYLSIDEGDIRVRSLVVSTKTEPTDFVSAVQEMDALVERRIGGFAIIGNLMGIFALLSLVLGAVGIYGVTAYSAGQRTNEIGVRLAMGAKRGDVVRMVVSQGAKRAVFGLVIGLGLAFAMGGAMSEILIGVSPTDPAVFGGVTFVLAAVSFVGLHLPARRVSRTDPVQALTAD